MEQLRAVLYGVLPGIAGGLLLVGVCGRRWLGLAIVLGVAVAFCLLRQGLPEWPHLLFRGRNDGMEWFVWCLLLAGAMSAAGGRRLLPLYVALPPAAALFALQVWLMLRRVSRRWSSGEILVSHGLAIALLIGLWLLLRRVAVQQKGIGLGLAWTACLSVDALVLLEGRSALQGQLAGGAAAALGAAVGTVLWRRPFAVGAAAVLPLVVAHGGLLLAGYFLSWLPPWAGLAAFLAPAGMLLAGPHPAPGSASGSTAVSAGRLALGVGLTGALAGLAVALVLTTKQ